MPADNAQILRKLHALEEFHIPYAAATNMPFVTCDEETCNDQIWMFTSLEGVQKFARQYEDKKIFFKGVRVAKSSMPELYMDLHSMGINEVVFCEEDEQHKLELEKIVRLPDFENMPENKRPLMNQALQLSTVYFFQEVRRDGAKQDEERLEQMAEEMYANISRARFLMPVQMKKTEDVKGTLSFPYIADKEGRKFQPIFSDHAQYMKHVKKNKPTEETRVLMVGVEELMKYLLKNVEGYMLNPDGYRHVLTQQQLEFICRRFL